MLTIRISENKIIKLIKYNNYSLLEIINTDNDIIESERILGKKDLEKLKRKIISFFNEE